MSDKVRVHEIAKELGIASKEVVDKAATIGVSVKQLLVQYLWQKQKKL